MYALVMKSLTFDMVFTGFNTAQAVWVDSWYNVNYDQEQWNTIKRKLRYFKDISNVVLCYERSNFTIRYTDSYLKATLIKISRYKLCILACRESYELGIKIALYRYYFYDRSTVHRNLKS